MQIHHLHDEMPEKSEHLRRDVINTMDVQLNPKTVRLESLSAMFAPNPPKKGMPGCSGPKTFYPCQTKHGLFRTYTVVRRFGNIAELRNSYTSFESEA
jgi:hypothetical protein